MKLKNVPGCCACANCDNCCIEHIDVTIGEPEDGEPGAAIGDFGWDVDTQPDHTTETQTIDGIPRLVCKQVYNAPVINGCSGTPEAIIYNTYFLTQTRSILYTYWKTTVFNFPYYWLEGNMLWRTYAIIQDLSLTVYRWETKARTVLSGVISQAAQFQMDIGARRRIYSNIGCALTEDFTISSLIDFDICSGGSECFTTNFFATFDTARKLNVFSINRDSGWIDGDCSSLPTNDARTSPDVLSDGYSPGTTPGLCRVPSGSTYSSGTASLGCTNGGANFYQHDYTYSDETVWEARHPITLTLCS